MQREAVANLNYRDNNNKKRTNKMEMNKELAQYIADYINEEMGRLLCPDNSRIDSDTIMNAVDAFDGGAR